MADADGHGGGRQESRQGGLQGGRHETLDAQLVRHWEREAARLDGLAAHARFNWMARGYARKAERARGLAARSRAREAARGAPPHPEAPREA